MRDAAEDPADPSELRHLHLLSQRAHGRPRLAWPPGSSLTADAAHPAPQFKGQESVDTEDGAPLYRCAKFEQIVCSCPNKGNFGFFLSNDDEFVPALKVQEALACKLLVLIRDMQGNVVGKVGQTKGFRWNYEFACHIAKGQDTLATLCIAIASEQIREQQANNGSG